MVQNREYECMEEYGGLLQPIRTVGLNKTGRCVDRHESKEEMNKNVKTLLNLFSERCVE